MALEDFYNINPIAVVDQNTWDDRIPEVVMNFQRGPTIYSPLIDWTDRSRQTGAQTSHYTDLLEGDVDNDPIAFTANYIADPLTIDSRERELTVLRYGDKVQVHKSANYFQMWKMSGGRDWKPLLRNVLGNNVRRKIELLSRNAFLTGPKSFWTYAGGAADFSQLNDSSKFGLDMINAWNLRLGSTGTPVIPGDMANAKLAIVPPGSMYDFQESLAAASNNEAQMWRDAAIYSGQQALRYEVGQYKNVRFVTAPSDSYGLNPAVLYNAGKIKTQKAIKAAINVGDGAPDPETTKVDETWRVGQKDVVHYIQLDNFEAGEYEVNDFVSLHTLRTDAYGVTNGVNFLSGRTIVRRIVAVDAATNRIAFDRPVLRAFTVDLGGTVFGYCTKAVHVGFNLILGSRGGIMGNVNKAIEFYEPRPVDDFESVWRYIWDIVAGYNIWEPNLFECHFTAVSLPKPGGVITPEDLYT